MAKKRTHQQAFESLTVFGSLLGNQVLDDLRELDKLPQQAPSDYGIVKGLKINDEITRYWRIARAHWDNFKLEIERKDAKPAKVTREWISHLLEDVLQYELDISETIEIGERSFPIRQTAFNGAVPVVTSQPTIQLDQADEAFGVEGERRKPAGLLQEYLNATGKAMWGFVSDGIHLRVYRDNPAMTRLAWLEVDFIRLFDEDNLADFAAIWLLLHASRLEPRSGAEGGPQLPEHCILEKWRTVGQQTGERALESLRDGVTTALCELGTGFLQNEESTSLRESLQSEEISRQEFYNQLLRLVYRLLFLLTAERREIVLLPGDEYGTERAVYNNGYSVSQLARRSGLRRHHDKHCDAWRQLQITFEGFANGQPKLAQPALGGLFREDQCRDIDKAAIDNEHLYEALRNITWFDLKGTPTQINYRDIGVEEFGSVYESLVEQEPQIYTEGKWRFGFLGQETGQTTKGNERKKTGSYYTPDSLVQELIKSALEPVIAEKLKSDVQDPESALLSITVVDPACGSGHFLLAAARRIAEELTRVRFPDGSDKPEDYRYALHEVISHCIFGVDRNPMALELARTALWLEGFAEGNPLSFVDHHLQCGDALLGLVDLKATEFGIPKAAFKPLAGDDKNICSALGKINTAALKDLQKKRTAAEFKQVDDFAQDNTLLEELIAIEAMPQETTAQTEQKELRYNNFLERSENNSLRYAADMLVGAFLLPKTVETENLIPTTADLALELSGDDNSYTHLDKRNAATEACRHAHVFHWKLAFPQVFSQGGFDCVLGNPPWERVKMQEQEFFASRNEHIALAKNKAERTQRLQWLSEGMLARHIAPENHQSTETSNDEIKLFREFNRAKRLSEAASAFMHVKEDEGGRYALTGVGDVNTYALFSETILQITSEGGRAGFIVPTGIATDDSTKAFFGHISQNARLVSLLDIENRDGVFPSVHRSYKFCLLTLGTTDKAEFAFFASQVSQLSDPRRRFTLTAEEFRLINPNTLTCPVFRSEKDAELTKKIYRAAPVLINENSEEGNPWGISFMAMMHMSSDSHLFHDKPEPGLSPLYEAKMIHQFDHRWATYEGDSSRDCTVREKSNPEFSVTPRYWVSETVVQEKLDEKDWNKGWLMGWRDICRATDERTMIASVFCKSGVGNQLPLILSEFENPARQAALLGNLSALVFDYIARHKVGGTHMNYFILKQLPTLTPETYGEQDLDFIVPRVLELTFDSQELEDWAIDLDFDGEPFVFNTERRASLRAELDAYYSKLYGLNREELRYILDPADLMGEDYPSETFRVLKNKEEKEFGEYRTQRLVLEAWDKLEAGDLH